MRHTAGGLMVVRRHTLPIVAILALVAGCRSAPAQAQRPRGEILEAARALIARAPFASLATVDSAGYPSVRAMDASAPDADFVVWLGTNPRSRKVEQIRRDPRVALHWIDGAGPGYVTLVGRARLVDDADEKRAHWKSSWDPFYPGGPADAVLVRVEPLWLEIVSIPDGLEGDPDSWRAEVVTFEGATPPSGGP